MTDRVYPSSKPTSKPPHTVNSNTKPTFPATKTQLYGATRPIHRPQPKLRRSRRSCCCVCFLWTTLLIIALILLAAIAGGVLWILYSPKRPTFLVTDLRISQFNITTSKDSSSHLNSKLDLKISASNPNQKLVFFYDPITITVKSNGVDVGNGKFPSFGHTTKNITTVKASVSSAGQVLEADAVTSLKTGMMKKKKSGLPLEIQLDTKVKVKMGGLKTKKVGIRVSCDDIHARVPTGKTPAVSSVSNQKYCKVNLRIKVWKWTFF
ncbi:hypothetical protein HHK36_021785 [Tetracentron sinense]|uniref:Late embryogenesis abundant protein LEA-2 subgroup domain-containing protein n=1 Tax=Tetracentron sinense TaxID=13715 RepID=A0A835D859_TETSI|nr:hypothetical protein HHK36_021785 [Tetracentron sinense]